MHFICANYVQMDYQIILDSTIGCWNCSKGAVREALARNKNKPVNVLISSLGGLLDDGLDIMKQFRDHGDVTAYISGFTASAATVAAMGAKKIVMGKYAFFLVHKCSNFIDEWGSYNADQIQDLIERLSANKKENDKIDVVLAQLYADRCGKSISDILDVLKKGEWMNAQEALDLGLVDEITQEDKRQHLSMADKDRFLNMGLPIDRINFEEENAPSWFTRFMNSFNKKKADSSGTTKNVEQLHCHNVNGEKLNTITMKKKFDSIGKVLDKEEFATAEDGAVTITGEEMQKVEDHMASLENSVAEKEATITDLEKQIENLQKQPGDETTDVLPVEDSLRVAEESKKLYDKIKDL